MSKMKWKVSHVIPCKVLRMGGLKNSTAEKRDSTPKKFHLFSTTNKRAVA